MYTENWPITGIATIGILGLTLETALTTALFIISAILVIFRFTRLIKQEKNSRNG